MRRDVLANAYEEECDATPHSQLWLRFVEGMSKNESNRDRPAQIPEMSALVKTFGTMAQEAPIASVFGALFAYESQVPRIASEKLAGLKQHYGADDRTCSYFTLHRTADVHHSNVWRKIISDLVAQDKRRVELWSRSTASGEWAYAVYRPGEQVPLESIGCRLDVFVRRRGISVRLAFGSATE